MARPARHLAIALALLLAAQWTVAFAHCLAPLIAGAGGHAIEICTPDGLRSLVLGEDGQPDQPPAPGESARHGVCPLCLGAAAPGAEGPALPAARIHYLLTVPPRVAGLPSAPARAPPQQPRAPPIA